MAHAAAAQLMGLISFCVSGPSPIKHGRLKSEFELILMELSYVNQVLLRHSFVVSKIRVDPVEEQMEDALIRIKILTDTTVTSVQFCPPVGTGSPDARFSFIYDAKEHDHYQALQLSRNLQEIREELTSLTKKMEDKVRGLEEQQLLDGLIKPTIAIDDVVISSRIYNPSSSMDGSNTLVGLDDEVKQLLYWILHQSSDVTAICGMAGIGKTTLVQQLHDHPSVSSHFDARIMVTLGPNFGFREYLLLVLNHVRVYTIEKLKQLGDEELEMRLQKRLRGKKWLMVMDDIWDIEVVIKLCLLLEESKNKSHIIFTTRYQGIHRLFYSHIHLKWFLNEESSWDLLQRVVFTNPNEHCPYKLAKIGRQIAKNCEGLPLAIVSVGELLSQNEKTIEFWESISNNENPLNIGIDYTTRISKSLYLSYEMLAIYAKPCFLYAGMILPKGRGVSVGYITELLIAEGLISPNLNPAESIESNASWMMRILTDASVVFGPGEKDSSGRHDSFRVHTTFRSLCIGIAQKDEFCHVINKYTYCFPQSTNRQPRVSIHNNTVLGIKEVRNTLESIPRLRSLLCSGLYHGYQLHLDFNFRLLKTLDARSIRFHIFPEQVLKLSFLRYLALTYDGEIPNSISKLQKLGYLNIDRHLIIESLNFPLYWPIGIWDLSQLKTLNCLRAELQLKHCTNSTNPCDHDHPLLLNLRVLIGISDRSCTPRIFGQMPNLRVLEILITLAPGEERNLSFFQGFLGRIHTLESFRCKVSGPLSQIKIPSAPPVFPSNILWIALSKCRFPWKYISAISGLPHLQTLELSCHAFQGFLWESRRRRRWVLTFKSLSFLLLEDLDIKEWRINHGDFPSLNHVAIKHCYGLRKIPMKLFKNSTAFKCLQLQGCNPSLTTLAKKIEAYTKHRVEVEISSVDD